MKLGKARNYVYLFIMHKTRARMCCSFQHEKDWVTDPRNMKQNKNDLPVTGEQRLKTFLQLHPTFFLLVYLAFRS